MMLLSLVENAIKHGLNPLREGGSIRIVAASDDGVLRVTVADTGVGLSTAAYGGGDGVGLSNIRSRLAALYHGRARLTFVATPRTASSQPSKCRFASIVDGAAVDERKPMSQSVDRSASASARPRESHARPVILWHIR